MANLKDINYGIGKYLELSDASAIPDIGTNRKNLDLLNFKVATNNAYALYNFKDGMIDAYQTEAGVDTATSTNETYDSTGKYYSGQGTVTETYHPNAGGISQSNGTATSTVTGTNNETATLKSVNSGGSIVLHDQAGKTTGIFTLIVEVAQMGGGGGPNAYGYAVVKNTDTLDNPPYSDDDALGYPNTSFIGGSVGDKIKVVYDTDNENVLTHYHDTGSGYGSASTTVNAAGPNFASTTLTIPYFYIVAWADNSTPWILTCSGTREYAVYNNMTLVSNAQTAQTAPTEGRLMIYEEASTGTITLDTDLKGYVSRDGGTTYTQTPLTEDTIYVPAVAFNQGGIDSNTKLMLHCDGSNGGTTFTDSSDVPHTVTPSGASHTDTAVKKFGTASAQFDGTEDFLRVADSNDWDFVGPSTTAYTVDFWVQLTDHSGYVELLSQGSNPGTANPDENLWTIIHEHGSGLKFASYISNSTLLATGFGGEITDNDWHHVAVVRSGTTYTVYKDGTSVASVTDADTATLDGALQINGRAQNDGSARFEFNGYMDEIRISTAARFTANFTPATRLSEAYNAGTYTTAVPAKRLVSGSVDISGQPSGTNMKYKIETLNQSASKVCRLHGASLLWA